MSTQWTHECWQNGSELLSALFLSDDDDEAWGHCGCCASLQFAVFDWILPNTTQAVRMSSCDVVVQRTIAALDPRPVPEVLPLRPWGCSLCASGAMGERAQDFAFKTDIFGVGVMAWIPLRAGGLGWCWCLVSWPGCLCVLLPLPVCQLALCGAGLWSQICLLHLSDVHKREKDMEMRACVCVCVGLCACVCSEANWSRLSGMPTRFTAWL